MSLTTINIWTGGPLFALWVGSRVQSSGPLTFTASTRSKWKPARRRSQFFRSSTPSGGFSQTKRFMTPANRFSFAR